MTFEEAIERIEEKCGIEDEDPFLAKERDLEPFLALSIIKNLKKTLCAKNQDATEDHVGIYGNEI